MPVKLKSRAAKLQERRSPKSEETCADLIACFGGLEEYKKQAQLSQVVARIASENAKLSPAEYVAKNKAILDKENADGKPVFI